jgi:hypothetical protein
MAKEVMCKQCKKKSSKEEMVVHVHETSTGNKTKMNFHEECLVVYLKDKEFKEKEQQEKDELNEVVKRIHNLEVVPSNFYRDYVEPLRGGFFKSGTKVKRYKEGIPYSVMKDSYLFIEKTVEYYRKNKEFDGSMGFLKYTFSIMVDKMPMAKKKKKQEEFAQVIQNENANIQQSHEDIIFAEREYKFKKKSNGGVDLSDLLD